MKKLSYRHDDDTDEELKKRMHQIAPNKCALLIYTVNINNMLVIFLTCSRLS